MFFKTKDGRILELDASVIGNELPAMIGEPTEEYGIYQGVEIIQKSNYVDDLFNRVIIISFGDKNKRAYKILTKYNFGKLSHLELIKDLGMGKKEVYGAIWVYGQHKEPSLKSVAVMVPEGKWKLL